MKLYIVEALADNHSWVIVFRTYNRKDAYTDAAYRRKFKDEVTRVRAEETGAAI